MLVTAVDDLTICGDCAEPTAAKIDVIADIDRQLVKYAAESRDNDAGDTPRAPDINQHH